MITRQPFRSRMCGSSGRMRIFGTDIDEPTLFVHHVSLRETTRRRQRDDTDAVARCECPTPVAPLDRLAGNIHDRLSACQLRRFTVETKIPHQLHTGPGIALADETDGTRPGDFCCPLARPERRSLRNDQFRTDVESPSRHWHRLAGPPGFFGFVEVQCVLSSQRVLKHTSTYMQISITSKSSEYSRTSCLILGSLARMTCARTLPLETATIARFLIQLISEPYKLLPRRSIDRLEEIIRQFDIEVEEMSRDRFNRVGFAIVLRDLDVAYKSRVPETRG